MSFVNKYVKRTEPYPIVSHAKHGKIKVMMFLKWIGMKQLFQIKPESK